MTDVDVDAAAADEPPLPNGADLLEAQLIAREESDVTLERRHVVALYLALVWANLEAEAAHGLVREITSPQKDT